MPIGEDAKPKEQKENSKETKETALNKEKSKSSKNVIIMCAAVAVVVVGLVMAVNKFSKSDSPSTTPTLGDALNQTLNGGTQSVDSSKGSEENTDIASTDRPWLDPNYSEPEENKVSPEDEDTGLVRDPNDVKPGMQDLSKDSVKVNDTPIEPDTFTKDLNGKVVAENYDIRRIYTTVDFVSYTKKRATTGQGVELYWLDASYKGQKAKISVPFSIFKEMDETGVVPVDVEIVVIDAKDDKVHEIATSFTVRQDYKEILDDARR